MNHRSIPSLSSSISSNPGESTQNSTPRTSSSSTSSSYINNHNKDSYLNQYQNYNSSFYMPSKNNISNLTHSNSLRSNYNTNTTNHTQQDDKYKRYSEPSPVVTKRWDDSQLEMELAEDDLIDAYKKKKVRRNSSLRLKQKFQLSAETYIIDKFRHRRSSSTGGEESIVLAKPKSSNKFSTSFKKVYEWLF